LTILNDLNLSHKNRKKKIKKDYSFEKTPEPSMVFKIMMKECFYNLIVEIKKSCQKI